MSSNGRLSPGEVTAIQGDIALSNTTARAWGVMQAAARQEHVLLTIYQPAGGYRDYTTQKRMYDAVRNENRAELAFWNIRPGVSMARPGLSTHGFGTAVDIALGFPWAVKNAARFGFTQTSPRNDPAHFMHDGRTAINGPPPADESDVPEGRTRMFTLANTNGTFWIIGPYKGADGVPVRAQIAPSDWAMMIEGQRDYRQLNAQESIRFWEYVTHVLPPALSASSGGIDPVSLEQLVTAAAKAGAEQALATLKFPTTITGTLK